MPTIHGISTTSFSTIILSSKAVGKGTFVHLFTGLAFDIQVAV